MVRFLRGLVLALTLTMIAGVVIIIALIVIRFREVRQSPDLPASIALPQGAEAIAFTQAPDWYAVVTKDDRILIYDRRSGALRQTVTLEASGE
ncbi:hypothetical protein PSA7680_01555 [Pseudoruegeria aquimaris]|uniref:Uncharacterized protein n=2 Tax=Pseudoruegeria aquimaris TaxID=393663 RepID=A0A1Y5S7X8_9RHOB|nr:hypothetical protein PSA7680_01555 [Pseudoruegeria aquimaris]